MNRKMNRKRCSIIEKLYGAANAERYHCYIDGKWDDYGRYTSTQQGYLRATKRIPAYSEEELLLLFSGAGVNLSIEEYQTFKKDEWSFLFNKLVSQAKATPEGTTRQ